MNHTTNNSFFFNFSDYSPNHTKEIIINPIDYYNICESFNQNVILVIIILLSLNIAALILYLAIPAFREDLHNNIRTYMAMNIGICLLLLITALV